MDSDKSTIRFLSFSNDKDEAEKKAKLKEAAERIEQAIAREKSLNELIDYKEPLEGDVSFNPDNDTRSLYDRLMEERNKKKEALEESQKLSNLVTKLDEDDASYLNEIAKSKKEEEIKKRLEVYDALEEKRRLDEKKMIDYELKTKQSLIGNGLGNRSICSLKSKLSNKIKVKPKNKLDSLKFNYSEASDTITRGQGTSSDQPKNIELSINMREDHSSCGKRQKIDDENTKKNSQQSDDGNEQDDNKSNSITNKKCYCESENIMKCIGILPSMPQVSKFQDSSEDSDDSDDRLNRRIIPRMGRRRK